jgi:hypothetical protein
VPEIEVSTGYEQREQFAGYHARTQRFAAMVCHRRAGKTVASLNDVIDDCLRSQLESPRFAYIAPQYRQAKEVAWDYLKRYTRAIPGMEANESELRVDLPGDRRIRLHGADNPDSLRGIYLDGAVLDEPAQMKPATWEEVIRPALSDRKGRATFIGTPKGRDWFYELFRRAERDPEWFTLSLPASRSGILPQSEIDAMTRDMSAAKIAQELECSFEAPNSSQYIGSDVVATAQARIAAPDVYRHAPRLLGVDVARHGDDESVILKRQGIHVPTPRRLRIPDLMQLAFHVVEEIIAYKPDAVFIDASGMGWGLIDRLRQLGYGKLIHAVQTGEKAFDDNRYYNLRMELWARVLAWLVEAGCLPPDDGLVRDLTAPEYYFDNRNRLQLEKKEDMKSRGMPSPDSADAIALTFAAHVAPRTKLDVPEWQSKLRALKQAKYKTRNPMAV